jgi:hypothetical protein
LKKERKLEKKKERKKNQVSIRKKSNRRDGDPCDL